MKSTFSIQTFHCPGCKVIQKQYVWSDKLKTVCDTKGCWTKLTKENIVKHVTPEVHGIRTDTKNRV
jgi:hypothetical protein